MKENSARMKAWRLITKVKMVESMGGCCQICGYKKSVFSLDFHHLDPKQKELNFGKRENSRNYWPIIVNELKKCILLCKNCHAEVHWDNLKIPIVYSVFNEKYSDFSIVFDRELKINNCRVCGKKIAMQHNTCSRYCGGTLKGTVDWTKIDLLKLLEENDNNYSKVTRILNETVKTRKPLNPEDVRRRAFKLRGIPRKEMIVKVDGENMFIPPVSKEKLLDLLNSNSTRQIAVILNICRATISKWCKYYDITINSKDRKRQLKIARQES